MFGWMGKILRVNLSDGSFKEEPLQATMMHEYVGGRGFNIKFLYDELKPGIDPLGSENKIVFSPGPACGTILPGSQRWTASGKSPLTGFIGDGNCGGSFGLGIKHSGYDTIIIEGKSEKPVYLLLNNGQCHFIDAGHLWGKKSTEVENIIKKELGNTDAHIASIGTAGDNMIRFATIQNDNRTVGKTGLGAVMGSKKLKAIVATGNHGVKVFSRERVEKLTRQIQANWRESSRLELELLRKYGSGVEIGYEYQKLGIFPAKNYRDGVIENYDIVSRERIKNYWSKSRACFSCPVACNHIYIVPNGPYAGTFGEDLMSPALHYTGMIGVTDLDFMFKLAALSDEYGVDEQEMGSLLGWLMECYEAGIIAKDDIDGIEMEWGSTESILKIMEKVVHREGIGNILAEGPTKASKIIGKGSEDYVMQVKGMTVDARDPRGSKGWALGYAVGSRGPDHCRHIVPDFAPEEMPWMREEFPWFHGFDRLSETGKGKTHKWFEEVRAFQHCLENCLFAFQSKDVVWNKVFAEMFTAVTGEDIGPEDVLVAGERIINLERAFNIREGLTRKDDTLPRRFLTPMPGGPSIGEFVNLDPMIDEYYEARSWDKETGFPTKKKLEDLGLDRAAEELSMMGKLPS